MHTSLLLMTTNQPPTEETARSLLNGGSDESTKPDTGKHRGRKPTRAPAQKKKPQRGMGVEQLERLRLEEWKKMTETNPIQSLNLPTQLQFPLVPTPSPFSDLLSGVPVHHGAGTYGGPPMISGCGGGGFFGVDGAMVVQRVGNGGGFGSSFGGLCSEQVVVDPYRVGAPDHRVRAGGSVFETSKELTSMPKIQCLSNRCDVCFKKMRFINGENTSFNGGRNKISQMLPINGCDFLGMNLQTSSSILNKETSDLSLRAPTSSCYASRNLDDEDVEIVAIHRKGNASVEGNVLMEYEFFPGKSGRNTSSEELEFPSECSAAEVGEASYITTSTSNAASNSIDLSLKLSY